MLLWKMLLTMGFDEQATASSKRKEVTELQAQLASEQQNFERQRTVTQQLDGQLQDALRELKVSMIEQ